MKLNINLIKPPKLLPRSVHHQTRNYMDDASLFIKNKNTKIFLKYYSTKPVVVPKIHSRSCVGITSASLNDFQEIPSPKGLPIIGTTLDLIAAGSAPRLHEYIHKRHQELGSVFREKIGPVSAVFISDPIEMRSIFNQEGKYPKHILPEAWTLYNRMYNCERGIFFMDGEEWLHFRRILNKIMLKTESLQWIMEPCEQVASTIVERWNKLINTDDKAVIPNLEQELYRFSIDTVIAILLGDVYQEYYDKLETEVTELASVVNLIFQTSGKLSLIPANLAATLRLSAWKNFVKAADNGLYLANKLMKKILRDCPEGNGLLSKMQRENMSEKDIQRIVADLILAASDTTAYSMQWTLYLLSKNEEVQEELSKYKSSNDITESTNNNLVKRIIKEALRLYPVAPFLTRILPQDTSLKGYTVPSNTLIIMSLYTSSRDPKSFPEPEKFWPDRWSRKNGNSYVAASPYASLPFAMGTRSCIGRKIAETQMHVALTKITKNFNMKLVNDEEVEMILRLVSVPSVPIKIEISNRN